MLSIIVPALNEEKYLPLLLSQIKKQNFADYEIIVADAGSQDKTVEIARSFNCKISSGGLPAKGRNEGAKIARGDTLLFTDADNIYLPPNFLENLTAEFKKRNLGVATFPIFPKGNLADKLAYGIYNWWARVSQKFLPHATNSVIIKSEVHDIIGGFDEEIRIAEDHEYARRAARVSKYGFIKTEPVLSSARRFEKDGRFKTYLKYLLAGLWLLFLGPIKTDIFNYELLRPRGRGIPSGKFFRRRGYPAAYSGDESRRNKFNTFTPLAKKFQRLTSERLTKIKNKIKLKSMPGSENSTVRFRRTKKTLPGKSK